jgi:transcriptional regulator NrdR family protein
MPCNHEENTVVNSRKPGGIIRRRRKCNDCGFRWSTFEITIDHYTNMKKTITQYQKMILSYTSIYNQKEK